MRIRLNFRVATLSLLLSVPFCLPAQDNTGIDTTKLPSLPQLQTPCDPGRKPAANGGCERDEAATTQLADQIKAGQTMAEVHALMGQPNRLKYRPQWEEWSIPSGGKKQILEVQYSTDSIVLWAHKFIDQSGGSSEKDITEKAEIANRDRSASTQSRAANVADKVANVAQGLMLGHYCPQVYRIPLIFMDANAAQWLQACKANGFMLFGVYVYTGGRQ